MHLGPAILTALSCTASVLATPHASFAKYVDWKTFKANGVNLGGWLVQESTVDGAFWTKHSGGADDEWGLCKHLGSQCGPVLESRYSTFITKKDIDKLANAGVELLRIPTTYAAWIKLPGSQLYSGNQQKYLKEISDYAIMQHGMHIILDLHSLPGGTNGLTIGEATGHWGWFYNQTALDYSLKAVDAVVSFVQNSSTPEAYTIEPINEPADKNQDMSVFGTPAALSDHGAKWVIKYIQEAIARVAAANPKIPVMFQGSFKHEEYWATHFSADTNLVFDIHNYYYEHRNTTSANLPSFLLSDAKTKAGDGKFPVFVGEWSIQTASANRLSLRGRNVNAGLKAYSEHARGSAYWTAKYQGNGTVNGEGSMKDYWNYMAFVDEGYVRG